MAVEGLIQCEQLFYDRRWEHAEPSAAEAERALLTVVAMPRDCNRVLDVGCGDGRISLQVSKALGCYVVGLDLSPGVLARLSLPKCLGSAAELPFPDRSFDLVMATEIMEHVLEALYPRTVGELARVAAKYILITVPNCENLKEHTALCGACGAHFHVWGHVRSYKPKALAKLFAGFDLVQLSTFGSLVNQYNKQLLWLRHRVAWAWYWEDGTVCHHCQAPQSSQAGRPFVARVCDFLNARLWAPHAKRASWLRALYARQSD